jgi:hypothetical protein
MICRVFTTPDKKVITANSYLNNHDLSGVYDTRQEGHYRKFIFE